MSLFRRKAVSQPEVKSANDADVIKAIIGANTNGAPAHSLAYQTNPYVFKAVNIRAEAVASIHLILEKADGAPIDDPNHPILQLLSRPNPRQSSYEFLFSVEQQLALHGIAYIYQDKGLYVIPAERVTPQQSTDWLNPVAYYLVDLGDQQKRVLPSDMLVICSAYKDDGYTPVSPLDACAEAVNTMADAQRYNRAVLSNGGSSSMVIMVPNALTQDQYVSFSQRVRANYTGDKAGSVMVLDGGKTVQSNNASNADLQYVQGTDQLAKQIAIALGVNPEVIGDNTSSCFNTMTESSKNFATQTVVPEINLITRALTRCLCSDGLAVGYDAEDIAGLRDKPTIADLTSCDWLTVNEKRQAYDYEPVDGGNNILTNMSLVPLNDVLNPQEPSEQLPDDTAPYGDSQ